MTVDSLTTLLYRIVLIADLTAIITFIAVYTSLAPWWRNQIGRTLVIKDILLILILIPSILSLFFSFNRLTSHIATWLDLCFLAALTPVMIWRIAVWIKIHKENGQDANADP